MKTLRVAATLPALLLSFSALAEEQTRQTGDFQGISVGGGLKARVTVGPTSVRLSGDPQALEHVQTEVEDGTLVVRSKRGPWKGSSRITLTISSPQMTRVEATGGAAVEAEATATPTFTIESSGGSTVSVSGLDSARVEVDASGGTNVTLKGRADLLAAEASGGCQVYGEALSLKALEAEASGGSEVRANPTERVTAEASGGSTVQVDSQPAQRHVSTSGGSKVRFPRP
ncbi:head GIN domain-containing protein [Stigmatella erecta]|uniref:Putative auto-transporter adhesin, head GIN domain n=1 Tax=Stigmatella erecta TaxID=83460 RepID=A0A1I0KXX9_9BACT|nr:head GIN domain-containing protein [Stigmatella erecta]SEU31393.1 Putative auto-transporter adhesin, head GIN domain [Stigmatella erecta]